VQTTGQAVAITVTDVFEPAPVTNLAGLAPGLGFIIRGDDGGDKAGFSVSSAGDVNGDGFDDMIVGARNADNGRRDSGAAYVIYGGSTLGTIKLGALTPDQGITLDGGTYDFAGSSVSSAGDVNGDGFDDLLVGATSGDGSSGFSGTVHLIYGGAGLSNIDLSNITAGQGITLLGENSYDSAGQSVSSAADVNGDGYDDVIIGVPNCIASPGESGRGPRGLRRRQSWQYRPWQFCRDGWLHAARGR